MNAKVLHTLEYDKIVEILSGYAGSEPARRMCLNLRPSGNAEWIRDAQDETAAALQRLFKNDRISFGANVDLRKILQAAEKGRTLSMAELLSVARLLICTSALCDYESSFDNGETTDFDCLSRYFSVLDPLPPLAREISRCILSEEEMSDDASSRLKEIRGMFQTITGRIHSQLNHMVNTSCRSYLQDAVITMRGDRYCIPVKAEYRSQVPGIVHDHSSTGSTLFIEPSVVVELDNKLTQLRVDEKDEIARILSALSSKCAESSAVILEDQKNVTLLDFIFAKAKYAMHCNATRPIYEEGRRIVLRGARHPLLDPSSAVPIDVALGDDYDLLIVTGPNTGGKTVSLKTVGLLTLMGQAGLHIPARDRSVLSIFHEVFADIGDEQSIEQSLSTFSSHMTSIVQILKKANADSLCLFDELGAGTDPVEGAALAKAILTHLHEHHIRTMATTHYSELKEYALSTPGVENAGCEFDIESLRPTYRLLIGIPGKSNAFAISKQLGLPESIIETAGTYIDSEDQRMEDVISDLESRRIRLMQDQENFEERRKELDRREQAILEKEEKLSAKRDDLLNDARLEAKEILKEAKSVADETIRAFTTQGDKMKITTMEKKRGSVREQISKHDEAIYRDTMKRTAKQTETAPKKFDPKDAVPGTRVHVRKMGIDGEITSAPDNKGYVNVQCGIIASRVRVTDLSYAESRDETPAKPRSNGRNNSLQKSASVSPEINLIGCTVDEAIHRLGKYLDDVTLSGIDRVRVVHGKGSGALRHGIHEYLKTLPFVTGFELAAHGEGDAGVTIVRL